MSPNNAPIPVGALPPVAAGTGAGGADAGGEGAGGAGGTGGTGGAGEEIPEPPTTAGEDGVDTL